MVASAFLTLTAVSFVQIPLQNLVGTVLNSFLSLPDMMKWLALAGIPQILLSGLVQEAAKLIPVIAWWLSRRKEVDPRHGLLAGVVAGLGFGVFEAV
jgi:RsiW-degrading membrane proteinase PrsW (M82 family)